MVDFEPGMMTSFASAGTVSPACTKCNVTPGSSRKGSRSSKLAMRGRRKTAILSPPPPCSMVSSRARASSAGKRLAAAKWGITPRTGLRVSFSMILRPSPNSDMSPWKLLISTALRRAASDLDRILYVPTILAITPPR